MNELSRLLSGRQIRLHASRLSRRPGAAGQQQGRRQQRKLQEGGQEGEEEEEAWDEDEDEEEDEDEGLAGGEEEDEDETAPLEGEARRGQYYRNSALAKPSWAGRAASPPEALAYLATRAVPNFSVALRVLREAAAARGAAAPVAAVLDVGCGPGSGLLAARTLWGGEGGRLRRLEGVDHSGAMRDLAQHLLADAASPSQEEMQQEGGGAATGTADASPPPGAGAAAALAVALHRHLPPLAQQAARTGAGGPYYDVVLASWTLSELPSDASRALAVGMMWELVAAEGGVLVLVEDGSPEGSRLVRSARKLLLEPPPSPPRRPAGAGEQEAAAATTRARARTLAPCPHDRPCPLLRDDWCRFTQRVPLGRLSRGGTGTGGGAGSGGGRGGGGGGGNHKDVAFSYVILQKSSTSGVEEKGEEGEDARLAALRRLRLDLDEDDAEGEGEGQGRPKPSRRLHAPTEADWEAATEAAPARGGWARLIRNPKKAKGHVHLDLCLPGGRLERRVVARSASKRLPGKYLAARKAQWGGVWPADKGL